MGIFRYLRRILVAMLMVILISSPIMEVSAGNTYSGIDMFGDATSIKGMQGAERANKYDYGEMQHSLVNIHLDDTICSQDSLWAQNGWAEKYVYNGETFYFKEPSGWGYIENCNDNDMSITVVFLLRWGTDKYNNDSTFLIDEDSQEPGYNYYAPNTDLSTYGGRAYRAYWHYLMDLLVEEECHIDNFVLGNEVNMPNAWHYSGSTDPNTVATKYADAFYYMYSAVREHTDVSRCSISIDHSWNHNDEGRGIGAREFLHIFNNRLAQHEAGVDWCVSAHLYPALLYDTRIWEHPYGLTSSSSDTDMVDGTNLSAMTNYIKDVFGEEHRVMLTEQGFTNACGADAQAACLAYTYYAAMYDPMVDAFLINTENAGGDLDFRIEGTLAGEVYTKIDNGNAADQQWIADVCLPVIGASSWAEIIPNWGIVEEKIDYSAIYNTDYYYNNNPDLAGAFGYDEKALFNHFVTAGMSEGRQASEEFNVWAYKNNNPDLVKAYGDNTKEYYIHYNFYGKNEGRDGITMNGGNQTSETASEYAAVYNTDYYYNNHPDLADAFGYDEKALFNHFVTAGMSEGRQASEEFNVWAYKNNNPDLVEAYGDDTKQYYVHYNFYGKAEGRDAVTMNGGNQTSETASEYTAVYNTEYYYNNNPDLADAFGYDEKALFNHFIAAGMSEGRQASEEFNVWAYKNNNPDLVEAYGENNKEYYMHYNYYGKAEGRDAVTMSSE